jgi:choloylglycine hydrolase
MNLKRNAIGFIALAVTALGISSANACTGAQIITEDKAAISGRTLEFGIFLDSSVAVVPRGYEFTGSTKLGDGKKWTAKYASVGIIVVDNITTPTNTTNLWCCDFVHNQGRFLKDSPKRIR